MATREVNEVEMKDITIKMRGARRSVEILRITEIQDLQSGKQLARNRHREAIDLTPFDRDGNALPDVAAANAARLIEVLGTELAQRVTRVARYE